MQIREQWVSAVPVRGRAYGGTVGRTQRYQRVLLPYVDAAEDAVRKGSATSTTRSEVAHSFKPSRRSGPKIFLKAECIIVGSCAYFSEQGQ